MNVEVYLVMWLNVLMSDQFIVIEQTSINVCPNVGVGLGGRKNAPMCSFTIKMVRMYGVCNVDIKKSKMFKTKNNNKSETAMSKNSNAAAPLAHSRSRYDQICM